jgi:hypothetical protein
MRLNRRCVSVVYAACLVLLPWSVSVRAQNRSSNPGFRALARYANVSRCDQAAFHRPQVVLASRTATESRADAGFDSSCDSWTTAAPPAPPLLSRGLPPTVAADLPVEVDPVRAELQQLGSSGETIGQARLNVLGVLDSDNRCSAWFRKAVPDPASTFRSLHFELDRTGAPYTLKAQDRTGRWFFRQPYMAQTYENAGAGATITINRFGAFFMSAGQIRIVPFDGGPSGLDVQHPLRIDYYTGGTPQAHMVVLLHEFGHILGMLEHDGRGEDAGWKSSRNTELVLHYCRKEVDAAGKHRKEETRAEATRP